ncbi:Thymidylate synthase [ANME-1 cluster archaeon GoMg2]|nr:Thymidylate synthase [ANME-1 cluster archaeon GoMg2]
MNNRIYILYHGSFGELVMGHLVTGGFADRIVGLYDLKVASVSLDDPEKDLPEDIPLCECDLLLVLGILPKAGDLVPIIVERTSAKAVLWPIEDPNLIPEGKYSIENELKEKGIHVEFPEPLCLLDRSDNEVINAFVEAFGKPKFELRVNAKNKVIEAVKVIRDTPCGSASKIAAKLVGMSYEDMNSFLDQIKQMHDNECVAYMGPDRPIMQQAGELLADAIKAAFDRQ